MRQLSGRRHAGARLLGLVAVSAALACASNSAGDTTTSGYSGMARDTLTRDTTVIRDSTMSSDTVRMSRDTVRMNSSQRGGNLPDSEIRQRNADSSSTVRPDSTTLRDSTSRTDSTRASSSSGTPQR